MKSDYAINMEKNCNYQVYEINFEGKIKATD